jgi:hypothetical protein
MPSTATVALAAGVVALHSQQAAARQRFVAEAERERAATSTTIPLGDAVVS